MIEVITDLCASAIRNLCVFAVALPIYGLFIFIGVKIARIENAAYGTSVKVAFLAFFLTIFLNIGTTYFHPLAASILATFILPFGIKRVFQTTYVLACLASVIVLCLQIVILIAISVAGFGVTHMTGFGGTQLSLLPSPEPVRVADSTRHSLTHIIPNGTMTVKNLGAYLKKE